MVNCQIFPDGHSVITYPNKDIKQSYINGNIAFFNSTYKSVCYEFPLDAYKVIKYINNRTEQIFYNTQIKLV